MYQSIMGNNFSDLFIKIFFFIVLILVSVNLYANHNRFNHNKFYQNKLNYCSDKISRQDIISNKPSRFIRNNNLLSFPGFKENFVSRPIIVKFIIKDQYCNPIPNAKLFLWQKNSHGVYPYKYSNFDYTKNSFTANGVTYSNSIGEARFVTIVPNLAPHYLN
ncbi:MAG TPA: hypothetical protein QKA14_02675, partial [Candidatus Megaira endosymbiont of Hartmannula sinica]|nr:hypothetical protein [Candidatus Megaera endosymbiont of Hartmannula sinica]